MSTKRIGIAIIKNKYGTKSEYCKYLLSKIGNLVDKRIVIEDILQYGEVDNFVIAKRYIQENLLDVINDYDEIIIFDDSIYGPLYEMNDVFHVMDSAHGDAGYWGITEFEGKVDQYFMVIRLRSFSKEKFNICLQDSKFAVFCNTESLEAGNSFSTNFLKYTPLLLIKGYKSPFVSKYAFASDRLQLLQYNHADEIVRTVNFIKKNYDYDLNMIYEDLIETINGFDIMNIFNMYYSIDPDAKNEFTIPDNTVLVIHLYYMDLLSKYYNYIKNVPDNIDIIITTDSQEKANKISHEYNAILKKHIFSDIRIVSPRGRDVAALVVDCADLFTKYDYLGFIHDKKSSRNSQSLSIGETFSYELWDNMLSSKNYIYNVLNVLKTNKHIGLLVPPPPYHGPYMLVSQNYWTICFSKTKEFLCNHDINVNLLKDKLPLSLGSTFWCKTQALKDISKWNLKHEDFLQEPVAVDGTFGHVIERSFSFIAQNNGYCTAYLATRSFVEAEVLNFKELYYDEIKKTGYLNNDLLLLKNYTTKKITEQECKITEQENKITELNNIVFSILQSKSWKITRPFRSIVTLFKKAITRNKKE